MVLYCKVGNILGSEYVDQNGLVGVLLHERHMLVGGGVVDYLRVVFIKNLLHARLVLDVGDDKHHAVDKCLVGLIIAKFELEVVHGRLGLVDHDDALGLVLSQLAAYLAAD